MTLSIKPLFFYYNTSAVQTHQVVRGEGYGEEILFEGTYAQCCNFIWNHNHPGNKDNPFFDIERTFDKEIIKRYRIGGIADGDKYEFGESYWLVARQKPLTDEEYDKIYN